MTLSFGNMTVNLNIFNVIKGMGDEEDMCEINMVDSVVQNTWIMSHMMILLSHVWSARVGMRK